MLYRLFLVFLLSASHFDPAQASDSSFGMTSILRRLDKTRLKTHANALKPSRRLDDISGEQARAAERASGVGAFFSKAIKQIRGGTDEFYRDLVTSAKITLCEHGLRKNSIRFVNISAENAYKDDDGDCVRLSESPLVDEDVVKAYTQGQCEVMPNCYWAPIEHGDIGRAKVYADLDSPMNKDTAANILKNWVIGIIGFMVPGLLFGVLSLLTMIFFLLCRWCCNYCGGHQARKEGYTRAQKWLPLLFFLFFAMVIAVISTAALLYRNSILGSVDEIFSATSGLLKNGSDWVVSIRNPLENVRDKVNSSVDLVILELNDSDFIEAGVYGLIGKLRAFGDYSVNRTLPDGCSVDTDQSNEKYIGTNGNLCLPCDVCTTISMEIDTASDEIETKAEPGVQQLINVRSQLNDKLVNVAASVRKAVNSKVLVANDLITTLNIARGKVDHYNDIFQTYRDDLGIEIMKLFYFAGGIIILGTAGILFGLLRIKWLVNLMQVAYFLGFIVLIFIFIIGSVVLALGIVLGDSCEVTLIFTTNWTVPLGNSARAVDACFQNVSLLDVFNLSSQLSFARGGINFPSINVNSMLDFSALDNFSATIATTTETTFEFSENYFEEVVTFVNTYASQNALYCKLNDEYKKENILQPWIDNDESSSDTPVKYITKRYETSNDDCRGIPDTDYGQPFVCTTRSNPCQFSEFMGEQFKVLINMASIKSSALDFVNQLQQNVTDVVEFTYDFKSNITNLLGRIERIKENLENSLMKYVSDFEEAMYCTFIADGFFSLYDAICADMVPSITMIGLMLLAIGLFLVPVTITLIIGVERLKARRFGPVMASGTKPIGQKLTKLSTD